MNEKLLSKLSIFLLVCFLSCCTFINNSLAQQLSSERIQNEVLIKFKKGVNAQKTNQIRSSIPNLEAEKLGLSGIEKWVLPSVIIVENIFLNDVDAVIQHFESNPNIEVIEPNYELRTTLVANDPGIEALWGLNNTGQTGGSIDADIDAQEGWDIQKESPSIKVGVVDSGIDWTHPDLVDNIWQNLGEDDDGDGQVIEWTGTHWILDPGDLTDEDDNDGNGYVNDLIGWDFINNDNNPYDDFKHGTHVAGTIGAEGNNLEGISGVTWKVQMAALKAFNHNGKGSTSKAIEAIDYAIRNGFHITNNSYGGGGKSNLFRETIQRAGEIQQIFVASAGNNNRNIDEVPRYPASYNLPNVITVAASNHLDKLAGYSNYGNTSIDLLAPGSAIFSCFPNHGYGYLSGTSMAAPHVAGAIALLMENCKSLTIEEIKDRLLQGVDPITGTATKPINSGRLNLNNILQSNQIDADFTYNGSDLTLNFLPNFLNGDSYLWQFNDGVNSVSNEKFPTYTFSNPGTYPVSLTIENGCTSFSAIMEVEVLASCNITFTIISSSNSNNNAFCQYDYGAFGNNNAGVVSSEWRVNGILQSFEPSFEYFFTELGTQLVSLTTLLDDGSTCSSVQEIYVHTNARNLNLGEDISICANGTTIDSELPGMAAYFWDLNDEAYASGTSKLTVTEPGTYRLTIIDHCDEIVSDEIVVNLESCSDVWPGNTNNDDKVDIKDVLTFFTDVRYQSGPTRNNATHLWRPEPSPDWDISTPIGVNAKHVDCNGDGIIDPNIDGLVIDSNYTKVKYILPNTSTPLTQSFQLKAKRAETSLNSTDIVFELNLQNQTSEPLELSGMAFYADVQNGQNLELLIDNNEITTEHQDLYFFKKRVSFNRMDGAIGLINGSNFSIPPFGSKKIARFIIEEDIVTGDPDDGFDISDVTTQINLNSTMLINVAGEIINLVGSTASSPAPVFNANQTQNNTNDTKTPLSVALTAPHLLNCEIGTEIAAFPQGGTPPYQYLWSDGETTSNVQRYEVGRHEVTVTDAEGTQVAAVILVDGNTACDANSAALPMELISFTATPQPSTIVLNWVTTNEWNIKSHVVERSLNGVDFEAIDTVEAKKGSSNKAYHYEDKAVINNVMYYYRIRSNETDKALLSPIQSAKIELIGNRKVNVFPNPATQTTRISFNQVVNVPVEVEVYNRLGQLLNNQLYYKHNGLSQIDVKLNTLEPGLYLIKIKYGAQYFMEKVLKH